MAPRHGEARVLRQQEPGRGKRLVCDEPSPECIAAPSPRRNRSTTACASETADEWPHIVAIPADGWRVVVCGAGIQWILQRRRQRGAGRPWRAVGYVTTREALMRLCARLCGPLDPSTEAALASLPAVIGREV